MPYDMFSGGIDPDAPPAQSASKRKEVRQRVLMRAHIHMVRSQSNVIVTDISRSGLRGTTEINLRVGQPAYVSIDDVTHVAGSIKWAQDNRFGMTFSKLLDVIPACGPIDAEQLAALQVPASPTAARLLARLSLSSWSSTARIRNVSKTGMMIETDLPVIPEQKLLVQLSNGKIFDATVQWVEGDRVGIRLPTPASILNLTFGDIG